MNSTSMMMMYPCNRGMGGMGVSYHYFQANSQGIAVCVYCGKKVDTPFISTAKPAPTPPTESFPEEDPTRYLIPGLRTHAAGECHLKYCAIHNPSTHALTDAPLHYRVDRGILERICKHGVGHDDPDDLAFRRSIGREADGIHGCDGCCFMPE